MAFVTPLQQILAYLKQGRPVLPSQPAGAVNPYPGAPNPATDLANQTARLSGNMSSMAPPKAWGR
jgi:hypothetical protein